jgi:hypothetical protein
MSQYIRTWIEDLYNATPTGVAWLLGSAATMPRITTISNRWLGEMSFGMGSSTNSLFRRGVGLSVINADANRADVEILQTFDSPGRDGLSVTSALSVGARISGTEVAANGYFMDCLINNDQVKINRVAGGVETAVGTAVKSFSPGSPVGHFISMVHVRFRCVTLAGSPTAVSLKARVWFDNDPEPSTWLLDVTDTGASLITAAGDVMCSGFKKSAVVGGLSYNQWYMSVGTGGDTAPNRPVTYQEWVDFMYQSDSFRTVLFEVDVLAQDDTAFTATTGKLLASNTGYVASPADPYPNACYEELMPESPRFRRRLSDTLTGLAVVSYGDMLLKSEVDPDTMEGALDDWSAYTFDGNSFVHLVGHPSWRRVDFRVTFRGTVDKFSRQDYGEVSFSLRGLDAFFQLPLTTQLIGGTGPNANDYCPVSISGYQNVKPPVYDQFTYTYQVDFPGANYLDQDLYLEVRDAGETLNLTGVISAVDTATETLSTATPHNLEVGMTWQWDTTGVLPAGLDGGKWYVQAVPTTTTFRLCSINPFSSPTPPPKDITSATTGAGFIARAYDYDEPTGRINTLNQPAGDITVDIPTVPLSINVANALIAVFYRAGQTNPNFPFNSSSGGRWQSAAYGHSVGTTQAVYSWWPKQTLVGQAIVDLISSINASLCITREGLWYLVQLDVPTESTSKPEVTADDIRNWREGIRFNPSHSERLGYNKNFTIQTGGDLVTNVTLADRDLYGKPYTLSVYSPPATTALDQPDNHKFATFPVERETLLVLQADADAEVLRLYTLYSKMTGTYVFETDAWAMTLELGDEILITYPRDGFAEGKYAIVVGLTEIASSNWVEVEVFCQIDGKFPMVPSTNPIVSEDYY